MWLLCLPHLPCFPGHLLYLHILQSARDQGQDFWRHLQGLWRTSRSQPHITYREEPHGGAEQHTTWQRRCLRFMTHPFFDSYMLKESLKEWAKKTMRTGTFFPPLNCCYFLLCTHILAHSARLTNIKQIWYGWSHFQVRKAPGTRKNNLIFPVTNVRRTEKSWQYFCFSHL